MGFGRAVSKAAKKVNNRGLAGNRDAEGNFVSVNVVNDADTAFKQEALDMSNDELAQVATKLDEQISSADEAQAAVLQTRLDIINEEIEARKAFNIEAKF